MSDTLGQVLEKTRRSLGRSLPEAEADTRIRARLLQALERGEYEALPSPAYVKGYVISYAKFLGLDAEPLLELYEQETGQAIRTEPVRLPEQVVAPRGHGQHLPLRTGLIVLGVLVLLVTGVWGVGRALRGPEAPPPIPAIPEDTSTAEPSVPQAASPGVDGPGDSEARESAEETPFTLRVVIATDSASWLRITVDGLVAYEGTMAGGQTQEWEVAEEASLRIGRPTAVTVYRDGEQVEIPPGDPPTLVLSASE
ncbi:MAG: helix-turn-helix domain-containing protein [Coriobacteriia bacterium]|nr:helix-turn-helix domain-containing protein [Coriobacteriia bacterium]